MCSFLLGIAMPNNFPYGSNLVQLSRTSFEWNNRRLLGARGRTGDAVQVSNPGANHEKREMPRNIFRLCGYKIFFFNDHGGGEERNCFCATVPVARLSVCSGFRMYGKP
jgi:hypothetical protein